MSWTGAGGEKNGFLLVLAVLAGILAGVLSQSIEIKLIVKIFFGVGFLSLLVFRLEWAYWIFILLICWLPSRFNQEIITIGTLPINVYDPIFILLVLAWLIERFVRRQSLHWTPLHAWLLLMLALVLASAMHSLGDYDRPEKMLSGLLDWFRIGLFFVMTYDLLERTQDRKNYFYLLALASFVVAAYGLYSYFFVKSGFSFASGPVKMFSYEKRLVVGSLIGGGATTLAGFLILTTPMVFAQLLRTRLTRDQIALAGILTTQLVMTILTFSRGGWMSLGLGFFFTIMLMNRKPIQWVGRMLIFIVVLLLVWNFLPREVHDRFATAFNPKHQVNQERVAIWEEAFKNIQRSPVIGTGPNNLYGSSVAYDVATRFLGTYHPHNWLVFVLVEYGIVGAIWFFGFFIWVMGKIYRQWRAWGPERVPAYYFGIWAGIAGFALHSQVDYFLWQPRMSFVFWLMLLLLASLNKSGPPRSSRVDCDENRIVR